MARLCVFWTHLWYVLPRILCIDLYDKCHNVNVIHTTHKADILKYPDCTRDPWSDTLMCNYCFFSLYVKKENLKKIDCTKRTWQWLKQITSKQTFMNPFIVELLLSDKIHEFHKQNFNADQKTNTELYTISMISRIFFQLDPIKTIKWYGIINDWYSIILGDVLSKRGIWK